jgi:hypothetical protein
VIAALAPAKPAPVAVTMLGALLLSACGERRDIADLAAGVAPLEQLRGMNAPAMRSGGIRAFRRNAEPAPGEGLRERIGGFDVVFGIPGFAGDSGQWPSEDALIYRVEATREWPSDSAAREAFGGVVRELRSGLGVEPRCLVASGPAFSLAVAEWDRGGGWSVTASLANGVRPGHGAPLPARHSIAVRRQSITTPLPGSIAGNADERPTWRPTTCVTG